MTTEWTERTELLLGADKMERLKKAHILIVGTGGVGAYAAEMLARAGVGKLTLLDADKVQLSNLNRQVIALHSTLDEDKVRVLERRLKDVNPDLNVTARAEFLEEGSVKTLLTENKFDFVVDAIDTIAPKCALIMEAMRLKVPIVSSMGAGAKTDVTQIRFADLWSTYHCGLSKAVRTRLKKEKMQRPLPVVFCTQQADMNAVVKVEGERNKKTTTGQEGFLCQTK